VGSGDRSGDRSGDGSEQKDIQKTKFYSERNSHPFQIFCVRSTNTTGCYTERYSIQILGYESIFINILEFLPPRKTRGSITPKKHAETPQACTMMAFFPSRLSRRLRYEKQSNE
jgi:hypothetical protein